jgi:hypothetical protein
LSQGFTIEEAAQMAISDMSVRHTKEIQDATVAIEKDSAKTKQDIAMSVANSVMSIGTSLFGKTKALAVAQAIMDTYAGANSAIKSTPGGPIVKALAAAAVIASGIANVKKILSTKIGSSSASASSGASIPSTRQIAMQGVGPNMGQVLSSNAGQLTRAGNSSLSIGESISDANISSRSQRNIVIDANVDRRGLAIAVREGEQEIRTEQFTYT